MICPSAHGGCNININSIFFSTETDEIFRYFYRTRCVALSLRWFVIGAAYAAQQHLRQLSRQRYSQTLRGCRFDSG